MPLKLPPPPDMGRDNQRLNRWLLEIQSILNAGGLIEPADVDGLPDVIVQVGTNKVNITALTVALAALSSATTDSFTAQQAQITALAGRTTALEARAQVLNGVGAPAAGLGNVNDWYANIGGAVGARIYVKTGVATWTAFPF